jgi:hypothetical protein
MMITIIKIYDNNNINNRINKLIIIIIIKIVIINHIEN